MDKYRTAFDNWLKSDELALSVKLACIAAGLSIVSQLVNIAITIYVGTDFIGVAVMLVVIACLAAGLFFTIKRKNHYPLMVMLILICFVMMPLAYISSGGMYSANVIWILFSAVILGSIIPGKKSLVIIIVYLVLNSAIILYDGFNPNELWHLSDASFAVDLVTGLSLVTIFILLYMRLANRQFELKNDALKQANNRLSEMLKESEEAKMLLEESYLRIEHEKKSLDALAEIYNSMYLINIKLKTYEALGTVERSVDDAQIKHVQQVMWDVMRGLICTEHLEDALRFTDFSTINERMRGKRSISFEAINYQGEWWRFLFIRVGDLDGDVSNVIYTSQFIDEEVKEKEQLIRLSSIDALTGVFNRNAYITSIIKLEESGLSDDFWYMTVDINGLKAANDNLGHDAGDLLITGTAECLSRAIGKKGEVIRVGGDEYAVFVQGDDAVLERVLADLDDAIVQWNKNHDIALHISRGYVRATELPGADVGALSKEADARMYADKHAFYERHPELDRRSK